MSKWREIRWYAKGTPTKTTKRLRRQHSFKASGDLNIVGGGVSYYSPCGLKVFASQLSKVATAAQKCANCLKSLAAASEKASNASKARKRKKEDRQADNT